jgi:hypothetical protein
VVAFSLCVAVAVLRYRLFDIDPGRLPDAGVHDRHWPAGGVYARIVLLATEVLQLHGT